MLSLEDTKFNEQFKELIAHLKRCQSSEQLLKICLKNHESTLEALLDSDHLSDKKATKIKDLIKHVFNES